MYSSASLRGFFIDFVSEDCIEISNEKHMELLLGESADKMIDWDKKGNPVLVNRKPPKLSREQQAGSVLAKREFLMTEASNRINPLQDAVDLSIATDQEIDLLKNLKKFRVDLSRVELQDGFPFEVTWPENP